MEKLLGESRRLVPTSIDNIVEENLIDGDGAVSTTLASLLTVPPSAHLSKDFEASSKAAVYLVIVSWAVAIFRGGGGEDMVAERAKL